MKVWMRGWKKVERIHSVGSYTAVMAMGKRIKQRQEQTEFWVAHTELPRTAVKKKTIGQDLIAKSPTRKGWAGASG